MERETACSQNSYLHTKRKVRCPAVCIEPSLTGEFVVVLQQQLLQLLQRCDEMHSGFGLFADSTALYSACQNLFPSSTSANVNTPDISAHAPCIFPSESYIGLL